MEMTLRIGDHMMVVQPLKLREGDDRHEVTAWVIGEQPAARSVVLESEVRAIGRDFLAVDPDENGILARYFPELMP